MKPHTMHFLRFQAFTRIMSQARTRGLASTLLHSSSTIWLSETILMFLLYCLDLMRSKGLSFYPAPSYLFA